MGVDGSAVLPLYSTLFCSTLSWADCIGTGLKDIRRYLSGRFTILSDLRSELKYLIRPFQLRPIATEIASTTNPLASISFCRCPSHIRISGNEEADREAKMAACLSDIPLRSIHYRNSLSCLEQCAHVVALGVAHPRPPPSPALLLIRTLLNPGLISNRGTWKSSPHALVTYTGHTRSVAPIFEDNPHLLNPLIRFLTTSNIFESTLRLDQPNRSVSMGIDYKLCK